MTERQLQMVKRLAKVRIGAEDKPSNMPGIISIAAVLGGIFVVRQMVKR